MKLLAKRASNQLIYRENFGGIYRDGSDPRATYPFARLPTVCRSIPRNILIRRTVVDNRIGRNELTTTVNRPVIRIPYDFDIANVLDEVARLSSQEFASRIIIVYPQDESQAEGAGVYRNWLSRMFERLLPVFFVSDQSGIHRLKRDTPCVPQYRAFGTLLRSIGICRPRRENLLTPRLRAIGRLLASMILDSSPFGEPLNYGLYKFLIEGPNYEWVGEDLRLDDPDVYKGWNVTIDSYMNEMDLGMRYVSLDGDDVLIPNGEDVLLGRMNIQAWANAALKHHMYGRYKSAYDAIRIGFSETLGSEPSVIFKDAMDVEDLRLTIEGAREVSTDQLMEGMEFQGFSDTEEVQVRSWLKQLLIEGGNQFRMNFLNFVTGWKSIPIGGFNSIRHIKITRFSDDKINHLPISHTCFQELLLPVYPTIEIMKAKLELAVPEAQLVSH